VLPLALANYQGRTCLVLDDPGGELLARTLGMPMDIDRKRVVSGKRVDLGVTGGRTCALPISVLPLALANSQGRAWLVLDDPGGELLARTLGMPMDIGLFLRLGASLGSEGRRGGKEGRF